MAGVSEASRWTRDGGRMDALQQCIKGKAALSGNTNFSFENEHFRFIAEG
jgi:hypothetical protein